MTIEVTQGDRDAAEGLGCITEERQSIVNRAFARYRISLNAIAAKWIDEKIGAEESDAFLEVMK